MSVMVERPDEDVPARTRRRRLPRPHRPHPGRHWIPQLTAALSGLLLAVAFPPAGYWWAAPLAVAGFTLSARAAAYLRAERGMRRPAVAAAWSGLWFGLAFCILSFKWVTTVGTDAWIILGIIEALYFIPFGAATAAVSRLRGAALWQALMWIAEEAGRDRWPFGGFSWGRLAFSQSHTVFTPLAALGGAPLVTFATALAGTALAALLLTGYHAWRRRASGASAAEPAPVDGPRPIRSTRPAWAAVAGWIAAAILLPALGWLVPLQTVAGKPVQLAAIQGDVPRTGLDAYGQESAVLDNHVAVTEKYAQQVAEGRLPAPAAVFWPEDSDDVDPFQDPTAYAKLAQAARAVNTQILVGSIVNVGAGQARNEGIVWDPDSGPGATYVKRHLVPLGEYIPYRAFLTRFISELSRVPRDYIPGDKPGVLTVGGVPIADVICFEVAYDDTVRSSVRGGGGVLVIQTNNATYGWSGQPEQQLAISQLRAVEHGRPVMIAATSGISAYITPDGNVRRQTAQFTAAVVAAEVTPRTGLTLADRVGAWPELAMAAAALIAWAFGVRAARRGGRGPAPAPAVTVTSEPMQPLRAGAQSVQSIRPGAQRPADAEPGSAPGAAAAEGPAAPGPPHPPPPRKART